MSLFSKLLLGVDLDEEQRRGEAADAALAALNREKYQSGEWTQSQFETAERNRLAGATGDVSDEVTTVFKDELKRGPQNVSAGINATLSGIVRTVVQAVPLSVWLIAAVALFVYVGGLEFVRRKLKA